MVTSGRVGEVIFGAGVVTEGDVGEVVWGGLGEDGLPALVVLKWSPLGLGLCCQ